MNLAAGTSPEPSRRPRLPARALILRLVGWTALAAALGLGAFVAYQLWFTNLQAANAQGRLDQEFAARVQAATPTTAVYQPQTLPLAPIVIPSSLEDPIGLVGGDSLPPEEGLEPRLILETAPGLGEPIGRIVIATAEVDWVVVEGGRPSDLTLGAGHIPWTPLPGQLGNAVISGHRTTYGAPFRHLDRVQLGDLITVETTIGTHTYEAVHIRVIDRDDTWVLDQWRGAWLTLTTCHPEFYATQRLVVIARLVDGPNAEAILGA